MVRRHDEPVTVRTTTGGATDGATAAGGRDRDRRVTDSRVTDGRVTDEGPRDFVWRGRRYTVCAVLASWQERRAWWREVGDHPTVPGLPSPGRRVWRVEARPPSGAAGVFDLGRDDDHWILLRAHD